MVSFYGEGKNAPSVKRYAEMLGLSNVRFCGFRADVADIWKENHALILPSRLEGLPITVVEAMMCGRLCIATDVGGSAEVIEDDVTGFVAEAPTARHLDEAMERAWKARSQWREIGHRAAARIREHIPRDPAALFSNVLVKLAGDLKQKMAKEDADESLQIATAGRAE